MERWYLENDFGVCYLVDDWDDRSYQYVDQRHLAALINGFYDLRSMTRERAQQLARTLPIHLRGRFA